MAAHLGNPTRKFLRSFRARRASGFSVEVQEFLVSGIDPTATGSVWQNTLSFKTHRLATGEEVEVYDDGTAMISGTGETLVIINGTPA